MEHALPIVVFDALQADNILKVSSGEAAGTHIGN
jgi:uridylate kinase